MDYSPKFEPDITNVRKFLSRVNADLSELGSFLKENSPSFELVNNFSKLPTFLQKELIRKFDSNYPKINQIFYCYNEVLKTLKRTSSKKIKENNHSTQHQNGFKSRQGNFNRNHTFKKSAFTLENISTKASKTVTNCKLCFINGHIMGQ